MQAPLTTRDRICEAAIRAASRDGLLAMTLENVAREAGVSKGGVMYHFPSKEDLTTGLIEYFGERCELILLKRLAEDPDPSFRWVRSLVTLLFPDPAAPASDSESLSPDILQNFFLTALAAAVNNPESLEPLRKAGARLKQRLLSDPADGLEQLLLWLAVDGLFLWEFVGLIRRDDPLYAELGAALRSKVASHRDSGAPTPAALAGQEVQ